MQKKASRYCLVYNIPNQNHTLDLRYFFSDFIESKKFSLFHFKNRPQKTLNIQLEDAEQDAKCCFVKLKKERYIDEFIKQYHDKRWYHYGRNENPTPLAQTCKIMRIDNPRNLINIKAVKKKKYMTRKEKWEYARATFIAEKHPPKGLERGNVGTSSATILENFKKGLLPAKMLNKLGIDYLPCEREFEKVYFDYTDIESKYTTREDDDYHEEWDINPDEIDEHEDEKVYEEEVEKTWEKGGSGLVFYTDAIYWNAQKPPKDEIDGFDVTKSDSEEEEKEPFCPKKILKKYGWKEDKGLGRKENGKTRPLSDSIKGNKRKLGLGYNHRSKSKSSKKIKLLETNSWRRPVYGNQFKSAGHLDKLLKKETAS